MPDRAASLQSTVAPIIEYRPFDSAALAPDVLAAITFGSARPSLHDPRFLRVGLEPLSGANLMEVWRANGSVQTGKDGPIRYASDLNFLAGVLELNEREHGGIAAAAEAAYAVIREFLGRCGYPQLLRVWNYFDDINGGTGDAERYKQFCIGRTKGMGAHPQQGYPAATVIGRRDGDPTLQIYWLSGRVPGMPLENPRQINPYRYPREYGPAAPQFSRAMLISNRLVMISGTASIVGHASRHRDDLRSQVQETLNNLDSVLQKATSHAPQIPSQLGPSSLLKIYLREPASLSAVQAMLEERVPQEALRIILAGDVCRTDLLFETDCVQGAT